MNYTNILACFGLDESSFIEKEVIPIQEGNSLVFYLTEAKKTCLCPNCKSSEIKGDGHYERRPNVGFIGSQKFTLRVKRQRYKCLKCNKSFTLEINGLDNEKRMVNSIEKTILNEFRLLISFKQIAIQNNVSPTYVIKLFDQSFTGFPRASMPRVLCIDEFYFSKNNNFKFCCILIDYEKHKVIDTIESRKIDFLHQYFDNIPLQERDRVKFFVSDMYGPYEEICSRYFKKALYITDKFHYKKQISEAFKKYRVYVMNNIAGKFTPEYSFLKREWKLFQCDYFDVEDKVKGNLFKSKYMNYKEKYTTMI